MSYKNFTLIEEIYKNGRIPISVSQLQIYNQCPFKWKCMYIDKIKDTTNSINLLYGNAIHEAIQQYLEIFYNKTKKVADEFDMRNVFIQSMTDQLQSIEDKSFVSKDEFREYITDGINFIDEFKKKAKFPKKGYELIGIEIPLVIDFDNGATLISYLDFGIKETSTGDIYIYDIKTSKKTWDADKKKDPLTSLQLLLYKKYYSIKFNVPIDKIKVIYYIAKRKIWEECAYPQKRIQIFEPPCGPKKIKEAETIFENFHKKVIVDGKYNKELEYATKRSPLCAYCHLKPNCKEWAS